MARTSCPPLSHWPSCVLLHTGHLTGHPPHLLRSYKNPNEDPRVAVFFPCSSSVLCSRSLHPLWTINHRSAFRDPLDNEHVPSANLPPPCAETPLAGHLGCIQWRGSVYVGNVGLITAWEGWTPDEKRNTLVVVSLGIFQRTGWICL